MKVLHIVENLNHGAVETWLVRMLRHARKRGAEADWTFYCAVGQRGAMDDEARSLGAKVVFSPVPLRQRMHFLRALRKELRHGDYEVLHCHHDLVSAVYLLAAVGIPMRRRIVHVHNADESIPSHNRLKRDLLREPLRRACLAMADRIVGISNHTLDTFLAGRARRPDRDVVCYYGVDVAPFTTAAADRARFRLELGLPGDALILLFAGRLVEEKNPVFVVDLLAELLRLEPRAIAVFAGTGALQSTVAARARECGVEYAVRLLGWRNDVPRVMTCCDWFVLPHPEQPMEGFGIAVVEAQLAGMRMLLSIGIADDPLLPGAQFRRLALSSGASAWAAAAVDLLKNPPPSRESALASLHQSPMDMDRALDGLLGLHA